MTSGDVSSVSPGAFEPDTSAPHVKNSYPTCSERGPRRRRPLPPPSVPPLLEGGDGAR
ncbi:hypothetical protein COCOR_00902 [Corallococcus coralloides DSM 2259]|jgi:hypothetical protein|uniref:Uncharacterized protein n=1 Tax=Corallococcus coralloides (strain ATCC 25202 / DSM 2259 / NBRC 100086 / M2) TaxID=1144275 RepID=H8MK70_CORCM|nr:hypothetical protein COCOR_00902 [Corallococcus coralloides DSM 2259]